MYDVVLADKSRIARREICLIHFWSVDTVFVPLFQTISDHGDVLSAENVCELSQAAARNENMKIVEKSLEVSRGTSERAATRDAVIAITHGLQSVIPTAKLSMYEADPPLLPVGLDELRCQDMESKRF